MLYCTAYARQAGLDELRTRDVPWLHMSYIKGVRQTKPGDLPLIILQKMHLAEEKFHQL